VSSINSKVLFS